jgi:hypothetical protein
MPYKGLNRTSLRIVEVKPDNSQKAGTSVSEDYGHKLTNQ